MLLCYRLSAYVSIPGLYSSLFTFCQQVLKPDIGPEKPEIIEQPSPNKVYYEGDQMNLSCEVLCRKPVSFTCFLNNEMLSGEYFLVYFDHVAKNSLIVHFFLYH